MKKVYEKPDMLIVAIKPFDIITTSGNFVIKEQKEQNVIAGAKERKNLIWD